MKYHGSTTGKSKPEKAESKQRKPAPKRAQGKPTGTGISKKPTTKLQHKGKTPSPNPTSPPRFAAATFGIELEFVLGFTRDRLSSVLSTYDIDADIVTHFSDSNHSHLLSHYNPNLNIPTFQCRSRSPSWALHVPGTDPVCNNNLEYSMVFGDESNGKKWVRRYVMEPLLIAKQSLTAADLESNVIGWMQSGYPGVPALLPFGEQDDSILLRHDQVDYSRWILTNDYTLIGALKSHLRHHLIQKGVPQDQRSDWDSSGVELVSPVFQLAEKEAAFGQIEKYLAALEGEDTTCLESTWAGLHVHIGLYFTEAKQMPVPLLQHLAYILVYHEDLLSRCHPRSRCGVPVPARSGPQEPPEPTWDDDDDEFDPDAPMEEGPPSPPEHEKEAEDEKRVLAEEASWTGVGNVDSNMRYLLQRLYLNSLQDNPDTVRNAIFQENGSIFDLVALLQAPHARGNEGHHRQRGYIYNFHNLWALARNEASWKPTKPTIEFRQHACTLDVTVIRHWVTLLEAIIRKAEVMSSLPPPSSSTHSRADASYAQREGNKYVAHSGDSTPAVWPYQTMTAYCVQFLDLSQDEGNYWQDRFDRYRDDRPQ